MTAEVNKFATTTNADCKLGSLCARHMLFPILEPATNLQEKQIVRARSCILNVTQVRNKVTPTNPTNRGTPFEVL